MRVLYVYNPYNAKEVTIRDAIRERLKNRVQDVEVATFEEIKHLLPIRATPALIILREDLQGAQLLESDSVDKSLFRVEAELAKHLQEEEKVLYDVNTHRIDHLVQQEVDRRLGEEARVIQEMVSFALEEAADKASDPRLEKLFYSAVKRRLLEVEQVPDAYRSKLLEAY